MSLLSKTTSPDVIRPGALSILITDLIKVDFPDPDSPTIPTI